MWVWPTHMSVGLKMSGTYWSHEGLLNTKLTRQRPPNLTEAFHWSIELIRVRPSWSWRPSCWSVLWQSARYFPVQWENGPIEYLHYISYDFLDFLCLMSLEDMWCILLHLAVCLADHIPATFSPPDHNTHRNEDTYQLRLSTSKSTW